MGLALGAWDGGLHHWLNLLQIPGGEIGQVNVFGVSAQQDGGSVFFLDGVAHLLPEPYVA